MTTPTFIRTFVASTLLLIAALVTGAGASGPVLPLDLNAAKVTLAGTSNVHDYTASTADVRVTNVRFAAPGNDFWQALQQPGTLEAFDLAIGAATLKSSKDGLDKNMYKALKVKQHADITFSLRQVTGAPGAPIASGVLHIAGVEREVTLPLTTTVKDDTLVVAGAIDLLMTDYGIAPPKALMGMVKAHPKVTVSFEIVLARATT